MAQMFECSGLVRPEAVAMFGDNLVKMPPMCVVCGTPPHQAGAQDRFDDQRGSAQWTVHTGFKQYTTYTSKEVSLRVPYCDAHYRPLRSKYFTWLIVGFSAVIGAILFLLLATPDSEPLPTAFAGGVAGATVLSMVAFGLSIPILRRRYGSDRAAWPFLAPTSFAWSMSHVDDGIHRGAFKVDFRFSNPGYLEAFREANPWVESPGALAQKLQPSTQRKARPKKTEREVLSSMASNLAEAVTAGRLTQAEADEILAEARQQRR